MKARLRRRTVTQGTAVVSTIVAVIVAGTSLSSADDSGPSGAKSAALSTQQQAALRDEFGLPADTGTVQQRLAQLDNGQATLDGGVVMTPQESTQVAELDATAQQVAMALRPRFERDDSYGGMYIDRYAGEVVVQAVGEAVDLRQAAAALALAEVVVREANFSYAALSDAAELAVTKLHQQLVPEGVTILLAKVNETDNVVEISVSGDSRTAYEKIAPYINPRMIRLLPEATLQPMGVNRVDSPPFAGVLTAGQRARDDRPVHQRLRRVQHGAHGIGDRPRLLPHHGGTLRG